MYIAHVHVSSSNLGPDWSLLPPLSSLSFLSWHRVQFLPIPPLSHPWSPRPRARPWSPRPRSHPWSPRPRSRPWSPHSRDRPWSPRPRSRPWSPRPRSRPWSPSPRARTWLPHSRARTSMPVLSPGRGVEGENIHVFVKATKWIHKVLASSHHHHRRQHSRTVCNYIFFTISCKT